MKKLKSLRAIQLVHPVAGIGSEGPLIPTPMYLTIVICRPSHERSSAQRVSVVFWGTLSFPLLAYSDNTTNQKIPGALGFLGKTKCEEKAKPNTIPD